MASSDHVDDDGLSFWIAEHADISLDTVKDVLDLERDYLLASRLAFMAEGDDYEPRHYTYKELAGVTERDVEHLARDAESKLDIPAAVARRILATEDDFMVMRGIA